MNMQEDIVPILIPNKGLRSKRRSSLVSESILLWLLLRNILYIQLLAKSLNTLSYFTQLPYHLSFSDLLKILKSRMISMHIVSFQKTSVFYNSYFNCIE